MSSFSKEWLTLREDADRRARNREIIDVLAARFVLREHVRVVDLGSGRGANLRAIADVLPERQEWLLLDIDTLLLDDAKNTLIAWADNSKWTDTDTLVLRKGRLQLDVRFKAANLAQNLADAFSTPVDLVTGSAFFDLVSPDFIRNLVQRLAAMRSCFYAALTYNGIHKWQPHRPLDNQMSSAFHRHQLGDKGFGAAAGPEASAVLADQLRLSGYTVQEGDSPWQLERSDRMLVDELVRGHAMAVAETGLVEAKAIETWVKVQRTGVRVGHTDIFAAPA